MNDIEFEKFEQETQVDEDMIKKAIWEQKQKDWLKEIEIPAFTWNENVIESANKPIRVNINRDTLINFTKNNLKEEIIMVSSLGDINSMFLSHDKKDFNTIKENITSLNKLFGDTKKDEEIRNICIQHILNHKDKDHPRLDQDTENYIKKAIRATIDFTNDNPNNIIIRGVNNSFLLNRGTYKDDRKRFKKPRDLRETH